MSGAPIQNRWTDDKRLESLSKWHRHWEAFSDEATQLFVHAMPEARELRVLDLASGSGEPALSIAAARKPGAQITLTDISQEILDIAHESARARGIVNAAFKVAALPVLPFPDSEFDVLTCRFGVMFFPEPVPALRECLRVLRSGGQAFFLVWRAADQPYFASTIGQLRKYADVPADSPETLSPFRFAREGLLQKVFEQAGFTNCLEKTCEISLRWRGTAEGLCQFFVETAGFYRPYLDGLAPDVFRRLKQEVEVALSAYAGGGCVSLPARVALVSGTRP